MSVSVPEKTFEHWVSQYILYRFRSKALLWWPAFGADVLTGGLPRRPGKAVSFELKTTTTTGGNPNRHHIDIDLGQLWNYVNHPLGLQPFYVFPIPNWSGSLDTFARRRGMHVTDLAFRRSGSNWWFANWTVAMPARDVAKVLAGPLKRHGSPNLGVRERLLTIDVDPSKRTRIVHWAATPSRPLVQWREFWDRIQECGAIDWPQRIVVAADALPRAKSSLSYQEARAALVWDMGGEQNAELVILDLVEPNQYVVRERLTTAVFEVDESADGQGYDHRAVVFMDATLLSR
ncbi:hypothetical protein [Nocardia alni]|uniref:hypothetical protein n=1 Tax=Nocardia alni TaxID=2815723 RepID=UPI001C22109D|nr:hypothetical protein [Nocardia alni]